MSLVLWSLNSGTTMEADFGLNRNLEWSPVIIEGDNKIINWVRYENVPSISKLGSF